MKSLFILLYCFCFTIVAAENVDNKLFLNTDVFEIEAATNPQISPDGSQIVYVRQSADIMVDRSKSNIWIVGGDGRGHKPLLSGNASYGSPTWSPSGDRIAYVANAEGHGPELYVRWMDTGQTVLVSNLPESPSSISWSPDGSQIAFVSLVIEKPAMLTKPPTMPKGAQWAPPVTVIDKLRWRQNGRGLLEPGYYHVFVIPADGGSPRQLTSGNFDYNWQQGSFFPRPGALEWSPDGKRIILSVNRADDWEYDALDTELWSVDIANSEMVQLTDRDGPDFAPIFSPDGSKIAYLGYDDKMLSYHNVNVYLMETSDGSVRNLTSEFDRRVESVSWGGNSRSLYVSYQDHGNIHIATLSMRGDIESQLDDIGGTSTSRPYIFGSFSSADDGTIAYTSGTPYRPAEIAIKRHGKSATVLTDINSDLLAHKTLAKIEEITWQSSYDGQEIQGWVATPPGFDPTQKYPLILEIHGGPFAAYGPSFAVETQLYTAAGYVVLFTNPRGSTSYGADFANEIHHNYPGQGDYEDLISGVDAVIARGYIDDEQLFVTGGSGGGILTSWIVGKTGKFAAAVSAKPVINWTSMALVGDIHSLVTKYWFAKPPWEDHESYWRRSTLSQVGNVTTPTMMLTGDADTLTPMSETEQFYQALKLRKIDTALVRVVGAGHGIAGRPSQQIAKVDNILAWFAKYRKN